MRYSTSLGFSNYRFPLKLPDKKNRLKTPWSVTFISLNGPPKFILMQPLCRLMVFSATADTDLITRSEIALHNLPCRFLFSMVIKEDSHQFNEILASAPQVDFIGGWMAVQRDHYSGRWETLLRKSFRDSNCSHKYECYDNFDMIYPFCNLYCVSHRFTTVTCQAP